jgi:hypothetical protein
VPVTALFENLEDGAQVADFVAWFPGVTLEQVRALLPGHVVATVYELGWSQLQNGELIRQAELAGYAAFVTTDQSLRYQQQLAGQGFTWRSLFPDIHDVAVAGRAPVWRRMHQVLTKY